MEIDETDPWMDYMRRGEFEKAWKISDAILKTRSSIPCWHLPRHLQYIWNGSSLENKIVLIRCYHGLGDTIQFIRYVSLVKSIARNVIVWAQPELIPILQSMPGIDQLIPLHEGEVDVSYEVDVEIMELPHIFKTTLKQIPSSVPYLKVDSKRQFPNDTFVVGLVWKAGDWNPKRSIPFSLIKEFSKIENSKFIILQKDAPASGWNEKFGTYSGDGSLIEFAQKICSLDLLITVDSMPAHLAGALGIPVWTLLHHKADWRWLENRKDSPWYPSMSLFRQEVEDDWQSVIIHVIEELKTLMKTKMEITEKKLVLP